MRHVVTHTAWGHSCGMWSPMRHAVTHATCGHSCDMWSLMQHVVTHATCGHSCAERQLMRENSWGLAWTQRYIFRSSAWHFEDKMLLQVCGHNVITSNGLQPYQTNEGWVLIADLRLIFYFEVPGAWWRGVHLALKSIHLRSPCAIWSTRIAIKTKTWFVCEYTIVLR